MTQNEYDKWYRELNETQKEVTDEFLAWKEKASKGKDGYADIVITMINGKAEVAIREGEYISPFRGFADPDDRTGSPKQRRPCYHVCRCDDGFHEKCDSGNRTKKKYSGSIQ